MSVRRLLSELVPFNPARLADNAARYSLDGAPGDSTFLIDGSNRIQLIADRSWNSGVNCLVLPGAVSDYASTPDSAALSVTADIDIRLDVRPASWTPAAESTLLGKWLRAGNQRSYLLDVLSTGKLKFFFSPDGISGSDNAVSSVAVPFSAYGRGWVRITRASSSGDVKFYTSTDGSIWSQLGTTQATTAGAMYDGTGNVEIGIFDASSQVSAMLVYRAQIRNNILDDGTGIVFDADFSRAAKLATSLTESSSNAATVKINTTGDLGARVCGERDLYQGTAAKQPIYSVGADGVPIATFNGSNDYVQSPPFALVQPAMQYLTGSVITFANKCMTDGNPGRFTIGPTGSGTEIVEYAGSANANTITLAANTRGVLSALFSGASSSLGLNKNTVVSGGNPGTQSPNGITVAARSPGDFNANMTLSELLVRSVADPTSLQLRIAQYYMRRYGIPQ